MTAREGESAWALVPWSVDPLVCGFSCIVAEISSLKRVAGFFIRPWLSTDWGEWWGAACDPRNDGCRGAPQGGWGLSAVRWCVARRCRTASASRLPQYGTPAPCPCTRAAGPGPACQNLLTGPSNGAANAVESDSPDAASLPPPSRRPTCVSQRPRGWSQPQGQNEARAASPRGSHRSRPLPDRPAPRRHPGCTPPQPHPGPAPRTPRDSTRMPGALSRFDAHTANRRATAQRSPGLVLTPQDGPSSAYARPPVVRHNTRRGAPREPAHPGRRPPRPQNAREVTEPMRPPRGSQTASPDRCPCLFAPTPTVFRPPIHTPPADAPPQPDLPSRPAPPLPDAPPSPPPGKRPVTPPPLCRRASARADQPLSAPHARSPAHRPRATPSRPSVTSPPAPANYPQSALPPLSARASHPSPHPAPPACPSPCCSIPRRVTGVVHRFGDFFSSTWWGQWSCPDPVHRGGCVDTVLAGQVAGD